MLFSAQHAKRCREIGYEIFERARKAEPRVWQAGWWEQQLNQFAMSDPELKVQSFRFIDVLPTLLDDADVAGHLKEYLNPRRVTVPALMRLALSFEKPDSVWGRGIGWMARRGAYAMAKRFITGSCAGEAIATVRRLRDQNLAFTLDVLGEATHGDGQADRYAATYLDLIDALSDAAPRWPERPRIDRAAGGPQPRVNVSLKLTSLDPHFDAVDPVASRKRVCSRLRPILRRAMKRGAFVNIDMESFRHRDLTLDLFESLLMEPEFREWAGIGIVVQAYLQDGANDLRRLLDWVARRRTPIAIRLVKGAYWDAETVYAGQYLTDPPVWTQKWESDATFERLARTMLEHHERIRPAFASHNVRSLASVLASAEELGLSPLHYELQMLYGMGNPLKTAMVDLGQCVRVYCPYGDLIPGMAYLIRRLLENTSNDSFLRQGFGDRAAYDDLLADPAVARPPSTALPKPHFKDIDEELPMSSFENVPPLSFAHAANRERMVAAIQSVRGELGHTYPLLIGGRRVATEAWIESVNPARPSEVIGRVACATIEHADDAVATAAAAWQAWRHVSAADRARYLNRAADLMLEKRLELSAYIILEVGKPWREAEGDVREAIDYIRFYAEYMERLERSPRVRNIPGEDNVLTYEPRGVCAVIAPWNFPLALLMNMTSAALAGGNAVVMKPSSAAAVVAAQAVELFRQAGLPPGVLNYLPGRGREVGTHLAEHLDVPMIAFTGSCENGMEIIRLAGGAGPGQRHLKKVVADMSGKNAIIVDHDADLDAALEGIIESAFAYAGQKCTACSRVIVLAPIYQPFCKRLVEAVRSIRVGPAEEPGTLVGPVIDAAARDAIRAAIEHGKTQGRLLVETDVSQLPGEGYYVGPTVIADVDSSAMIAQEEIFGPVLAVLRADNFEHALRIANDSKYALTGGVYSRSPENLELARREFHVGNLYINRKITGSRVNVQPFGGYKLSGMGSKAGSPDYLLQFVHQRTITENTLRHGFAPLEEETAGRVAR